APAGAWRVWAEPETGGEAYIPLARSKRARSEAILADVAERFGMALTPVRKYADGGYYHAQQSARLMRHGYAPNPQQSGEGPTTNWNMTINYPTTRDPMQDAWEQARSKGWCN